MAKVNYWPKNLIYKFVFLVTYLRVIKGLTNIKTLNCIFKKSALYDDVLTIHVFLKKKPMVKIEFDYEIINQNEELISTGNTSLAFIDMKRNKPTRCPNYLLEKLMFEVLKLLA